MYSGLKELSGGGVLWRVRDACIQWATDGTSPGLKMALVNIAILFIPMWFIHSIRVYSSGKMANI